VIAVESDVMMLHGPHASGHLVGQRDRRLVVALPGLQRQCPCLQMVERLILSLPNLRRTQGGARSMDE
jgi:hypothetical protein